MSQKRLRLSDLPIKRTENLPSLSFFFSEALFLAYKAQKELARKFDRDNRKGEQKRENKLVFAERRRAEHTAPKVDKAYLHYADECDYRDKRAVFEKP